MQSADGGAKGESGTGEDGREPEAQEIWQQKNEEALDEEFQKDLEVRDRCHEQPITFLSLVM